MIQTTHACPHCQSTHLKKNGTTSNSKGKQKYYCHDCGKYGTSNPTVRYTEARKEEILKAYQERSSVRGLERTFGVARQTVSSWLKKVQRLPDLNESVLPAEEDDVLELDQLWSFVGAKANKQWAWIALCRRTRQVVAFVIGNRSATSCRALWTQPLCTESA